MENDLKYNVIIDGETIPVAKKVAWLLAKLEARNVKMLDTLKNIESDGGKMPISLWEEVQNTIQIVTQ